MSETKEITILEGQIVVTLGGDGGANIASSLREERADDWLDSDEDEGYEEYAAAIDAVESLILAHACAGVNIEDPAYVEGLRTAIETISNNF